MSRHRRRESDPEADDSTTYDDLALDPAVSRDPDSGIPAPVQDIPRIIVRNIDVESSTFAPAFEYEVPSDAIARLERIDVRSPVDGAAKISGLPFDVDTLANGQSIELYGHGGYLPQESSIIVYARKDGEIQVEVRVALEVREIDV